MPRSATAAIQVPGAPVPETDEAPPVDKDAQIAELKAKLERAERATNPTSSIVFEPQTPHGVQARAESKHLHLTAAELHEQVMAGSVRLTERHVLCKDGWYANPRFGEPLREVARA
jgi:hypothetical protein